MSPYLALDNKANKPAADAELTAQRCEADATASVLFADGLNVIFAEFGAWICASVLGACSALSHHVRHVVGVGAQEEMTGIDTYTVVANVEYAHSFRDWATGQFPCKAVGKYSAPVSASNPSVPAGVCVRSPQPTIARRIDLLPEAVRNGTSCYGLAMTSRTGARVESTKAHFDVPDGSVKRLAAVFADTRDGSLGAHCGTSFRDVVPVAVQAAHRRFVASILPSASLNGGL